MTVSATKPVRLVLDLDRDALDEERQQDLVDSLIALVGGTHADQGPWRMRQGCLILERRLRAEVADSLVEAFSLALGLLHEEEAPPFVQDMRELIKEFRIAQLDAGYTVIGRSPGFETTSGPFDERAVVLVHGLFSSPESFRQLPERLEQELEDSTNVLTYRYPSGPVGRSEALTRVAGNFDSWLQIETKGATVALVCHSMGGLVTRRLLCNLQQVHVRKRSRPRPYRIGTACFIATPQPGADISRLVRWLNPLQKQLRDLSPTSEFMEGLTREWNGWLGANRDVACNVFYGSRDRVVKPSQAQGWDPDATSLPYGHFSIVKVEDADHELVPHLVAGLTTAGY